VLQPLAWALGCWLVAGSGGQGLGTGGKGPSLRSRLGLLITQAGRGAGAGGERTAEVPAAG